MNDVFGPGGFAAEILLRAAVKNRGFLEGRSEELQNLFAKFDELKRLESDEMPAFHIWTVM